MKLTARNLLRTTLYSTTAGLMLGVPLFCSIPSALRGQEQPPGDTVIRGQSPKSGGTFSRLFGRKSSPPADNKSGSSQPNESGDASAYGVAELPQPTRSQQRAQQRFMRRNPYAARMMMMQQQYMLQQQQYLQEYYADYEDYEEEGMPDPEVFDTLQVDANEWADAPGRNITEHLPSDPNERPWWTTGAKPANSRERRQVDDFAPVAATPPMPAAPAPAPLSAIPDLFPSEPNLAPAVAEPAVQTAEAPVVATPAPQQVPQAVPQPAPQPAPAAVDEWTLTFPDDPVPAVTPHVATPTSPAAPVTLTPRPSVEPFIPPEPTFSNAPQQEVAPMPAAPALPFSNQPGPAAPATPAFPTEPEQFVHQEPAAFPAATTPPVRVAAQPELSSPAPLQPVAPQPAFTQPAAVQPAAPQPVTSQPNTATPPQEVPVETPFTGLKLDESSVMPLPIEAAPQPEAPAEEVAPPVTAPAPEEFLPPKPLNATPSTTEPLPVEPAPLQTLPPEPQPQETQPADPLPADPFPAEPLPAAPPVAMEPAPSSDPFSLPVAPAPEPEEVPVQAPAPIPLDEPVFPDEPVPVQTPAATPAPAPVPAPAPRHESFSPRREVPQESPAVTPNPAPFIPPEPDQFGQSLNVSPQDYYLPGRVAGPTAGEPPLLEAPPASSDPDEFQAPNISDLTPDSLPGEPNMLPAPDPIVAPSTARRLVATPAPPSASDSSAKMERIVSRRGLNGFKGFCPVAIKDHRELLDAQPEFSAVYNGRRYFFSSEEARASFDANPTAYAPAALGNDVVHLMLTGESRAGSLEHAVWFRSRLYMFTTAETMETFVASPSIHAWEE